MTINEASGKHPSETAEEGNDSPTSDDNEHIKPRLRLFLSIDLVGSTALKQGKIGERQGGGSSDLEEIERSSRWRDPILYFYQVFQTKFAQKWKRAEVELKLYIPTRIEDFEEPKFWKAAGDELIYEQLISNSYQACWSVRAWISAAEEFRKELRNKYPSLDVKMTAWVAGFPVINSEVVLRKTTHNNENISEDNSSDSMAVLMQQLEKYYSSDKKDAVLDYIGPSMDIGFRLCSLSTPREMPISLELAYILSEVRKDLIDRGNRLSDKSTPQENISNLPETTLRYMGRKSLKGVLDGRSYPVFWLDVAEKDSIESAEDAISERKKITPDQCLRLFKAFVEEVNNPLLIWEPYLGELKEKDGVIKSAHPPVHKKLLAKWLNNRKASGAVESERENSENERSVATDQSNALPAPELSQEEILAPPRAC
ncbi:MAG: hypothetical protein HQM04_11815 [Magnetococcales bacterium]|nr:hypothetical protein [Magnetococcales bacterium]MBF0115712.1 hypothetical protein [Magnetococcales bacterium]